MTTGMDADTIGRRIAAFRKERGISSTDQLAAMIADDLISGPVLRNIESGRKADLTVSQLLNIARALGVSPLFLLVPVARPFDPIDLQNLSPTMAEMTVAEFDEWLTNHQYQTQYLGYQPGRQEGLERRDLDVRRELLWWMYEIARLRMGNVFHTGFVEENPQLRQRLLDLDAEFNTTEERLKDALEHVRLLTGHLAEAGWDVSWITPDGRRTKVEP